MCSGNQVDDPDRLPPLRVQAEDVYRLMTPAGSLKAHEHSRKKVPSGFVLKEAEVQEARELPGTIVMASKAYVESKTAAMRRGRD